MEGLLARVIGRRAFLGGTFLVFVKPPKKFYGHGYKGDY